MEDRSKRPPAPSILWPGIILAAVGLYGYLTFKPKLETSRPKPSAPIDDAERDAGLPSHYARLWEDPLGQKYRSYKKEATSPESETKSATGPGEAWTRFLGCLVKGPKEDHDKRGDGEPDASGNSPLPPDLLEGEPMILPVLLDGTPDIETTETRMRTRYAVVAALTTAKYRPAAPKKMQYLTHFCGTSQRKTLVVPIEVFVPDISDPLYDPDDPVYFSRVVVCWLDEDEVEGAPLHAAASLGGAPSPSVCQSLAVALGVRSPKGPRIHVIGPASSDGLIKMAKEEITAREPNSPGVPLTVFSPRATVEPAILKGKFPNEELGKADMLRFMFRKESDRELLPLTLWNNLLRFFNVLGQRVRFVSVVGTDWHLACALRDELKLRDAWPRRDATNECVVLVTEKDTLYGRAIPNLFAMISNPTSYRELKVGRLRGTFAQYWIALEDPNWQLKLELPRRRAPLDGSRQSFEAFGEENGSGFKMYARPHAPHRPFDVPDPSNRYDFWEVQYGREGSWRHARLRVTKETDPETGHKRVAWRHTEPIVVYKYLRGMDGLETSESSRDERQDEAQKSEQAAGYRPAGSSQLDYLRRMEQELTALHNRQHRNGGRGILAIGVVGSDVYDKLLVLRALRKRFPKAAFFTTDLDANYSRLTELEYTRNLIVASHFGLRLHPSLQRDVPPFRRSYQTAAFLSVLWAVHDDRATDVLGPAWQEETNRPTFLWPRPVDGEGGVWGNVYEGPGYTAEHTRPLVFEIGLRGPYQLTLTNGTLSDCPAHVVPRLPDPLPPIVRQHAAQDAYSLTARLQPPSPRELPRQSTRQIAWGVAGLLALGILVALNLSAARSLFWSIGRSVWIVPYRLIFRRDRRWTNWPRDVAVSTAILAFVALALTSYSNHRAIGGEPFEWFEGVSVWPSTLLRLAVAILSFGCVFVGMRELEVNLQQHWTDWTGAPDSARQTAPTRPVLASGFVQAIREFDYSSFFRRICRRSYWRQLRRETRIYDWEPSAGNREKLLRDYRRKGSLGARSARIFLATFLYILAALAMFIVTDGFPNFPARGTIARGSGTAVLVLSIVGLAVVVFFVVDAIHLCQRFVIAVGKQSEEHLAGRDDEVDLRYDDAAQCLDTVRMLAERTNVVSKLLLYPFSALLLMILSRHTFIDNWDFPWSLAVLPIAIFLVLVTYALVLRRDARKARDAIIGSLRGRLLTESDYPTEKVIEQIENVNRGAFRPLTDDYVFRAIAIPFGGTGGLVLIEQLLPSVF